MKRAVLVLLLTAGCTTSPTVATSTAPPTSTPTAIVATTTTGSDIALAPEACPPEVDEREHCVWLQPVPGVSGAALAKRMNAAKFPVDVDGDKVTAYWKADRIEAFFGVKPGYITTGGGSGGTVCLMVMPKGARAAVKGAIAGWAIDDPVCEM